MVITWLPLPSYRDSIEALSDKHLGLQRLHVLHIIETLHEVSSSSLPDDYVKEDPIQAARMWYGYELQLVEYGLQACEEWSVRKGKRDKFYDALAYHLEAATSDIANMGKPPWFGEIEFHMSHQAALLREDHDHYIGQFMVSIERPLIWPESGYDG